MAGSDPTDKLNAHGLMVERWSLLTSAIEQMGSARSLDAIIAILRSSARRIAGADGIAIVLSDNGQCHYVAEDAKSPLWAGQRFPLESCISGLSMRDRKVIVIPDVMADPRVPHAAYEPTFVRSMVMMPIGSPEPIAAIGAYWSDTGTPGETTITLLETLSRAATTALENGRLMQSLEELNNALEARVLERTAELEAAQEIVRQSQKMDVIGQLTGNVAHDFNNLLTPIMGSLDLILERRVLTEGVLRGATVAMDAAERAQLLIQRLLSFARRQPLAPSPVDIGDLVMGMRDLLVSSMGSRVALRIDIQAGLPNVRADRHQLEMALLNLAVNGRDAMPGGGTLNLSAGMGMADNRPADLPAGNYVWLAIRDDGMGMDDATLTKAIEPFFSTKDAGHGTGLGLSMVHGLAAQLGGTLKLTSALGEGTTVTIWLPVVREKSVQELPAATDPKSESKALVIDDDERVREGTAEMLAVLGYDVIQAGGAREGLDLLDAGLDPAIVVTDHVMPGMTGAELALRLRADHPRVPVVIMSGYQGIDLIAPDIVRLSKPFRQRHLTECIAAARERAAA